MKISDFDYKFPPELIAKYPPKDRGASRLLVLERGTGGIEHRKYADLVDYLQPGDVVVLNDTKVIKARLLTKNRAGNKRELMLIEKHAADNDPFMHRAVHRGQIEVGETLTIGQAKLTIMAIENEGIALISSDHNLERLAEKNGAMPLPPYLKRAANQSDVERYQTVFAHQPGSVAAPTASLNFTNELANKLQAKGVNITYLTLHVGLGTFLPIRTDAVEQHYMHSEYFYIPSQTVKAIQKAHANRDNIVAIGTTVARTLEFAVDQILDQDALPISGEADIYIYPGYEFKVINSLLTNFHAPKSTVLMLAAAFAGWDNLKHAYYEAIAKDYKLLSYGDSMLII